MNWVQFYNNDKLMGSYDLWHLSPGYSQKWNKYMPKLKRKPRIPVGIPDPQSEQLQQPATEKRLTEIQKAQEDPICQQVKINHFARMSDQKTSYRNL